MGSGMDEAVCNFPTKSVGPARPSSPLTDPLVRIIFGDPRTATPALDWQQHRQPQKPVQLKVRCTGAFGAKTHLLANPNSTVLDSYADFEYENLNDFSLAFQVFSEDKKCIGSAFVLGTELHDFIGVIKRPIIMNDHDIATIVGVLTVYFVVVTPLMTPLSAYDFDVQTAMHSRNKTISYFTGHRGMGKTKPDLPLENTVGSFIESCVNPHINMIELDVQLTADEQPVVYHDWFFRPSGRDKDIDRSRLEVPLYTLTLNQFRDLHKSGIRQEERIPFNSDVLSMVSDGDSDIIGELGRDTIRTLVEVCTMLPPDIGIMVEVKYPSPNVQSNNSIPYPERNLIVDQILHALFSVPNNAHRHILFLTFEADIAQMLRLKQSVYPVFLSHCAGRDRPCEMFDPRCTSIRQGIAFCVAQKFEGIMFFDRILVSDPEAVDEAIKAGLKVITYGSSNSKAEWAVKQFEMGVEGVIADRAPTLVENALPLMNGKAEKKKNPNKSMLVDRNTIFS